MKSDPAPATPRPWSLRGDGCLVVDYGKDKIEWYVIQEDGKVVDLVPSYLPNDDDAYVAYDLSDFPHLGSAPGAVAKDIYDAFHRRQLLLAHDIVDDDLTGCDSVLATKTKVEAVVTIETETESLTASLVWRRRGTAPDVTLTLPRRVMPLSCGAFVEPPFTRLPEYVAKCKENFVGPWRRRRDLCREFQRVAAVVHLDPVDFSCLSFVVQISTTTKSSSSSSSLSDETTPHDHRNNNNVHDESGTGSSQMTTTKPGGGGGKKQPPGTIYVITLRYGEDYPLKPPTMSARHFKKGTEQTLNRNLYKYSPRWPPERVAKELTDHACLSLS